MFADSAVKIYVVNAPFAILALWSMMERIVAKVAVWIKQNYSFFCRHYHRIPL